MTVPPSIPGLWLRVRRGVARVAAVPPGKSRPAHGFCSGAGEVRDRSAVGGHCPVMHVRLASLGLGLFVLTGACTPEKDESTADASTSTGSATDGASSTPTGGDASTSTGDGATSVAPTSEGSTSDASSGATVSADTDTGGAVPACEAVCNNKSACELSRDPDGCVEACNVQLEGQPPACADATENYLACLGTLTCEQLVADMNSEPNPCAPAEKAMNSTCASDGCAAVGSGHDEACKWSVDCPKEPELQMECDSETCTCTAGGEPTGNCPAESICEDLDPVQLEAKFAACCGF